MKTSVGNIWAAGDKPRQEFFSEAGSERILPDVRAGQVAGMSMAGRKSAGFGPYKGGLSMNVQFYGNRSFAVGLSLEEDDTAYNRAANARGAMFIKLVFRATLWWARSGST